MSRAFVKETDGADDEELAELQVSPHRNLVTVDGLRQIEETVERLRESLSGARANDDRAAARRIQRDLRYWAERKRTAELVPASNPTGKARFGSVVVMEKDGAEPVQYRIVGEDEADPATGKISYVAPIARRLIGCQAGEEVELPDGTYRLVRVG